MAWLKNALSGLAVGELLSDSPEYEFLKRLKQPGTNHPLYEEISRGTLEHLIAGDAEEQMAEVTPLDETGFQTFVKVVGPLAAGDDATVELGAAQSGGNITTVFYVPNEAMVGQATDYRTLEAVDAAGPSTLASVALSSSSVHLTADVLNSIALGTPAVAEGDTIEWKSIHTSTGLADPGGLVIVTLNGYTFTPVDYSNPGYVDPYEGGE